MVKVHTNIALLIVLFTFLLPHVVGATTTATIIDEPVIIQKEESLFSFSDFFGLDLLETSTNLTEDIVPLTPNNTQDIWTTSTFSYDGIQPFPGGGLNNEFLIVGGWGDFYYSLIEFDISDLPKEASSVHLELYSKTQRGTGNTGMYLDRVTENWDWTEISTGRDNERLWWADRPNVIPLTTLPAPTENSWYSIDITDLYNDWQSGTYPNYGLQLRPTTNNNRWNEFYSSDYLGDLSLRPRLVITYEDKPLTLHEQAAELAKQLVDQPDAYELGARGWEYYLGEYATPERIINGYDYLSGITGAVVHGPGIDCSGLIYWAFNKSNNPSLAEGNYVANISADGMSKSFQSTPISESELQPGDLLFFNYDEDPRIDHVAMYVGESGGYDVVDAAQENLGIIDGLKDILKNIPELGFVGYRRIHEHNLAGSVKGNSPINLIVTDPDGNMLAYNDITPSEEEFIREVPGELYYSEIEQGHDGSPTDVVYIANLKQGDYHIQVVPETGALLTDTYTLEFTIGDQTTLIANDVQISDIPASGYGVNIDQNGTIETFIPINIDIKPGSNENSINLDSNGNVPVVVFGSNTFNVKDIDITTITLANASAKLKGNGETIVKYEDANADSFLDMEIHITTNALELTGGSIEAILEGSTLSGQRIKGTDFVKIVP